MNHRTRNDSAFLSWIADRLVNHYGESPNVDFVLRLRELAKKAEPPPPPPTCAIVGDDLYVFDEQARQFRRVDDVVK